MTTVNNITTYSNNIIVDPISAPGAPSTTDSGSLYNAGGELNWHPKGGSATQLSNPPSSVVTYDNTTSGLTATDVKAAIDELKTNYDITGVSIAGQSRQVVDLRLDSYGAIYIGAGTAPLDQRSDNGVGTPAALEYTTYGTLGTWNRGRFTADSDGTYHFRWVADQTTNSGVLVHNYQLVKNGSTVLFNTQYITSSSRVNSNEIDTYVELSANDYIEVYVGPNQTAGLICETMFYNVEKVATFSGAGAMQTINVGYDNLVNDFLNNDTPVSLYEHDSNWKLDLTEGKWLVTYTVPIYIESGNAFAKYSMLSTIDGDKSNAVLECAHYSNAERDRRCDAGSVILDITTPTSYTWWIYSNGTETNMYYDKDIGATNPDPDSRAILSAVRLSAPSVGDASAITYSNTTSGLTATNTQAAIDEQSFARTQEVTTTPVTLDNSAQYILVDTTAARTLNLPSASGAKYIYYIKDKTGSAGTNNITINKAGSDTIDGATSKVLDTNYDTIVLVSDGTSKWSVMIPASSGGGGSNGTDVTSDFTANANMTTNYFKVYQNGDIIKGYFSISYNATTITALTDAFFTIDSASLRPTTTNYETNTADRFILSTTAGYSSSTTSSTVSPALHTNSGGVWTEITLTESLTTTNDNISGTFEYIV